MQKHWLTRGVLIISLVSLFNDASSELLYPVLPIYLGTIGLTGLWIGIIEGVAEAAAGLSKGWFGKWSDMRGERLPFIRFGYFISSLAKPLIVLFPNVVWAMFMRASDRLGKGVRTGARDALLAHESDPKHRGKVFGFHRGFDTLAAADQHVVEIAELTRGALEAERVVEREPHRRAVVEQSVPEVGPIAGLPAPLRQIGRGVVGDAALPA